MKRPKRKKKLAFLIIECICGILFLASAGVFLYPYVNDFYYSRKNRAEIEAFRQVIEEGEETGESLYPELYRALQQYNQSLNENGQERMQDMMAYASFPVRPEDYGVSQKMIGYLQIPSIEVELPLYLGADYDNMADGAAVLGYSSAPIGGPGTNCVIAGHNSWKGTDKFRYIPTLKTGDTVTITNLWTVLTYSVTETKIINPDEFNEVLIQKDRDMVTLMTCHPYGAHANHRYLVYCERVEPQRP